MSEKRGDGAKEFIKELDGFYKKVAGELKEYDSKTDPKFDKAHELAVISLRLIQIIKVYEKKNPDKKDKNDDTKVPALEDDYVPTRSIVDERSHKKEN